MKNMFKFFLQLLLLIIINKVGFLLVSFLQLPLPGNVLGMVILLLLLMTNIIKLDWIDETASFFNKHLGFFFIPVCVGLMTLGALFLENAVFLIVILVVSAVIGLFITGSLTERLVKKREDKLYDHHTV